MCLDSYEVTQAYKFTTEFVTGPVFEKILKFF